MNTKENLMKKYPGTVIDVLDKSDERFAEKFGAALEKAKQLLDRPLHEILEEKVKVYGSAVSCCTPTGFITEGNVVEILPYGCEWLDKNWTDATIVVQCHETGKISHWRPKYVTFIGNGNFKK